MFTTTQCHRTAGLKLATTTAPARDKVIFVLSQKNVPEHNVITFFALINIKFVKIWVWNSLRFKNNLKSNGRIKLHHDLEFCVVEV